MWRVKLKTVLVDTGVNKGTNAGKVNVPDTTEETLSLVLAQTADAEEKKSCGALLADTPGTREEMCWEALLWIIIIIKALFKTERPISEVREEDTGIN